MVFLGLVPDTVPVNVKSIEKLVTQRTIPFHPKKQLPVAYSWFQGMIHTHTHIHTHIHTYIVRWQFWWKRMKSIGVQSVTLSQRGLCLILFPSLIFFRSLCLFIYIVGTMITIRTSIVSKWKYLSLGYLNEMVYVQSLTLCQTLSRAQKYYYY